MPTVLVADDDANIRELVCLFLRGEGYATVEAADGREALQAYAASPIDLAVLDIMMPAMDGWASCRAVRTTRWRTSPACCRANGFWAS